MLVEESNLFLRVPDYSIFGYAMGPLVLEKLVLRGQRIQIAQRRHYL